MSDLSIDIQMNLCGLLLHRDSENTWQRVYVASEGRGWPAEAIGGPCGNGGGRTFDCMLAAGWWRASAADCFLSHSIICTNILHCGLPWASPATDGNKMPSGVAQPKNYYPPCPKPAIPNQYFQRMAGIWSGTGERSKAAFMNCSISARCMVPLPVAGEAAGLRPT